MVLPTNVCSATLAAMPASLPSADTRLAQVRFCVLDIETTGGSVNDDAITEIGAVLLEGGQCLGSFRTFVHPGRSIPARISLLTGITDALVGHAPRPEAVIPSFAEFAAGAVIVGHNVRFDLGFLDRALDRQGFDPLPKPAVDTCAIARRILRDEVPDCRLGTLADHLRLDHRPTHRALEDALATVDLLHALLERAASFGVVDLDDLLGLQRIDGRLTDAVKLRLTERLPRTPGVYELLDASGRVLYVGKATNLRQRVRSYFSTDERRSIRPLLRELREIRHVVAPHTLAAEVAELRHLHTSSPPYNRRGKPPPRPAYVQLTSERFPRLGVVRRPNGTALTLGPMPSTAVAQRAIEAIETAIPLRRCRDRIAATPAGTTPCAAAQLGVAPCPCAGTIDERGYQAAVDAANAVVRTPTLVVAPLMARMHHLATALRFEEAAATRDRLTAFTESLRRHHLAEALTGAGTVELAVGGGGAELGDGLLRRAWGDHGDMPLPPAPDDASPGGGGAAHAEAVLIASWLLRHRRAWRLVSSSGPWRLEVVADQLAAISAPVWSMRSTFVAAGSASPSNAATTSSTPDGGHSVAIVGPDPDSQAHHAPAASAASSAARDGAAA
jgi:DNA polymerase III subunit epsilon